MKVNMKVAGTTFRPIPKGRGIAIEREFEENGVPCAVAKAVLQPEPENEYDPEAVKVVVSLRDGAAFHIGYIPRNEPLKTKIKTLMMAQVTIKDYGMVGDFNPSFIITEIGGM